MTPGHVGFGTVSTYTLARGVSAGPDACLGVLARVIVAIGHDVQKLSFVAIQKVSAQTL